jgi:putative ABC transport system permease protein
MWTLRREYRSTYRDHLTDSETLIEGTFTKESSNDVDYVPVSISKGLSEDMKLGIGDKLVFDIQGLPLDVEITSIRDVDWN